MLRKIASTAETRVVTSQELPMRLKEVKKWPSLADYLAGQQKQYVAMVVHANQAIEPGSVASNVSQEERKAIWYALRYAGYRVDPLTEKDCADGLLKNYAALYVCGQNLERKAAKIVRDSLGDDEQAFELQLRAYYRINIGDSQELVKEKIRRTPGVGPTFLIDTFDSTQGLDAAIRDAGGFMDPRSRKDWWRGK